MDAAGERDPIGRRRARRQPPPGPPPVVHGRIARIETAYPREVRVNTSRLAFLLALAAPIRTVGALLASLTGVSRGAQPGFKALRKGPEFLVTPVLVTDAAGALVPLEVHGHMSGSALVRGDRVRVEVKRDKDPDMPARVVRLENLTTGQVLAPRGATMWTHVGLGLILQAVLGLLLIGLCVTCLLGGRL